jgi:hypothetical protein
VAHWISPSSIGRTWKFGLELSEDLGKEAIGNREEGEWSGEEKGIPRHPHVSFYFKFSLITTLFVFSLEEECKRIRGSVGTTVVVLASRADHV